MTPIPGPKEPPNPLPTPKPKGPRTMTDAANDQSADTSISIAERLFAKLNRLTKWRKVYAWWQLGRSAGKGTPGYDAVADHRELSMLLRVEVSALANLLVAKGVFTTEEWNSQLCVEADELADALSKKFPGFQAVDEGLAITTEEAQVTMQSWGS